MTSNAFIGQIIGRYTILEVIGEGGLATVYKAHQTNLDRFVAIKMLHHQAPDSLARFIREAKAIAALRHQNILQVYDFGEVNGKPFMVMEYVPHGTLADFLRGQPLPYQQAISLLLPIAKALRYAHQAGNIHRDVKPTNILMAAPDWPLLADFGLVKRSTELGADSVTEEGILTGTPNYISPEQARHVEVDQRTDIYSLGVVLFEMVTGQLPFAYPNSHRVLLAHISEPPPLPRQHNATCPLELEKVILTMLQKSPQERYPDMQAVIAQLHNILTTPTGRGSRGRTMAVDGAELRAKLVATVAANRTASPFYPRLMVEKSQTVISLPIQETLIIGRTHKDIVADIDLEPHGARQAGVSRHHARLTRRGRQWLLEDLDSLNGTFLNERPLPPYQPNLLSNGDRVRCSKLSMTFYG